MVWITCGLLWCFYQLFGLSFWRHPFTAEHPLVNQWCNATFLQICSDEETNSSTSRMAWGWVHYSKCSFFEWTIPLTVCVSLSRWLKFEEDVEDGGERWSKPYVATLSLHSLFELRSCIINGTVMLDMRASSLEEIAGCVLY